MFLIITLSCVAIFLWEHFAIINNISYKPTMFIDVLTKYSRCIWSLLGEICAYIGTLIECLQLGQLFNTLWSFVSAIWRLITSFKYFTVGFNMVASLRQNKYKLWIDSFMVILLIISVILFTIVYFF